MSTKIALIGNVCNNMYNIGVALRKYTDIVPHLYIGDKTNIHTNPEYNDPLTEDQADWVLFDSHWEPTRLFKKLDFRFVRKLTQEKYDAIIVSDVGVWLAPFINNSKFFFWTTGADITRMPFPSVFGFLYKGFIAKLKARYMAFIQRLGIRHIDYFITQPFMPFKYALERLNVPNERVINAYFPIIIDQEIFRYDANFREKIAPDNYDKIEKYRFKIFHPSRLMIEKNSALHNSGQWKGNEMLVRGLRAFINKYNTDDICIVLPDRSYSKDVDLFNSTVEELNLQKNIVWVKGQTSEGFNKEEMVALYSSADLVVDEFGVGWFGSVVVEAAACGRPVMCHLDQEVMKQLYPWHPILSVNTPEAIAEEIAKIYFDKVYSERMALESRRWAEEFHGQESAGRIYAEQIKMLLAQK